ncbi:MAG: EAL domain-containing protein [Acholeplasmatales bacterium]|nr:EAL domain-containing protein [Acholeplasmatales bacterium]
MEKLVDFFYKLDIAFGKIKFFEALKRSFTMMIPVFIIGAFSLVMMYFPIEAVRNAIDGTFVFNVLETIYYATYGIAVIYLLFAFSYRYSETFEKNNTLRLFYIVNSIMVYFIFLGPTVIMNKEEGLHVIDYLSVKNIFPALIICVLSTNLFRLIHNLLVKKRNVPNHTFDVGIWSLLPIIVCVVVFGIIAVLIDLIPSINNFNDVVTEAIGRPFKQLGNSYGSGALLTTLESILWFFGIHGGNVLEAAKISAFPMQETTVLSKTFLDTFVLMGGCGTILSFTIAILIASKKRKSKKISYMSIGPMIFNINEITVFGIPIVLNPLFLIPFILVPFASYTIAFIAVYSGIVPHVVNEVYWTTPVFVSGYMATGSIAGSILQAINLFVGILIYIPFIKLDNYVFVKSTDRIIDRLSNYVKECESKSEKTQIYDLESQLSRVAENIANKLSDDIDNGNIEMYYQPLYKDGKIYSMESLLRFKYNDKFLYPPLVINIAIEKGLFTELSKCITKTVLKDLEAFTEINPNIRASINLQYSLISDEEFINWFFDIIGEYKVSPSSVGIEITEETSIPTDADMAEVFNSIRKKNIKMYLDDFSMGKTSIKYLQNNHFDYVKLDGSLVKNIDNERCQDIVTSIIKLGKDLEFDVIAEYVETKEILDKLNELGCYIYQGYYYSKPINKVEMDNLLKEDISNKE